MPSLSSVLSTLLSIPHDTTQEVHYTIFAPSYRGYWKSTGRPSQKGIEKDGSAIFDFLARISDSSISGNRSLLESVENIQSQPRPSAVQLESNTNEDVEVVFWGQSIGANIVMTLLANYIAQRTSHSSTDTTSSPQLHLPTAIILETPFVSIRRMVYELYPQKWLPYRYLTPLLWNKWDIEEAAHKLSGRGFAPRKILMLVAGKDEVVGTAQTLEVERILKKYLDREFGNQLGKVDRGPSTETVVERVVIKNALHVECVIKDSGRQAVVQLLHQVARGKFSAK